MTDTPIKTPHPGGRPSIYSSELADVICKRLANGESLISICKEEDMPNRDTIYSWLTIESSFKAEFSDKYIRARDYQADYYAEDIINIADTCEDANLGRLRVDSRKWVASKLKPKKYGDKLDMTSDGKALPTPIYGGLPSVSHS